MRGNELGGHGIDISAVAGNGHQDEHSRQAARSIQAPASRSAWFLGYGAFACQTLVCIETITRTATEVSRQFNLHHAMVLIASIVEVRVDPADDFLHLRFATQADKIDPAFRS